MWSAAFAAFLALCSTAAWLARRESALPLSAEQREVNISGQLLRATTPQKLLWLGLSACGSMLLLSVTNKLLEDVAPVPLLWVLPLALYLLTFALAFSRCSFYSRWWMARFLAVTLGSFGYAIYDPVYTEFVQVSVPVFCVGLFLCCLFCHGELRSE